MPPNPTILAFDTSAAHVAAALLSDGQIVAEHFEDRKRGQDAVLVPVLQDMLSRAGMSWNDIDAIGVGVGPGNFTGVRLSVATAKGLSLSLGVPAVGVSRFDAMRCDHHGIVYAAVAAPRGAIYLDWHSLVKAPTIEDDPALIEPLHSMRAEARFVGDVDPAWANPLSLDDPIEPKYPLAEGIARVAAARLGDGQDIEPPKPLYIKAPDAAPPKQTAPQIIA